MPVFLPIASACGVALAAAYWLIYGLPGLVLVSGAALDLCKDIFVFCGGYIGAARLLLIWTGASIATVGVVYGLTKAARNAILSELAIRRLPLYRRGGDIALILDSKIKAAFTHGLLRPRIYISKGLIDSLDRAELKAVVLHELHHKKRFDPLRFLLYSMLTDIFFYIPLLKDLLGSLRIRKEADADDAACRDLSERLTLAAAIVKAASFNTVNAGLLSVGSASIIGVGAAQARVERLVEAKKIRFKTPDRRKMALSIIGAAFVAASIILPLVPAAAGASQTCTTEHCSTHIDRLGEECRTHCSLSSANHRD